MNDSPAIPHHQTAFAAAPAPADAHAASNGPACDGKIVVVDDEPVNVKVVSRLLRIEGYTQFSSTSDARDALRLIHDESPDVVLLDLMMPHVSGLEILAALRQDEQTRHTPVVILTASTDRETRIEALRGGANDFLNKPIDPSELAPRVGNLLTLKRHQDRLRDYSRDLEAAVRQRTAELEASRRDILHCLARAAEFRDDDTGHHILRVGRYARLIAEGLGKDAEYLDRVEQAAQLHDVGKIGVADAILKKPGQLSEQEFELMQKHSALGKRVLQRMSPQDELTLRRHADIGSKVLSVGSSPVLEMATRIALTHHERWDGSGYPLGLQGEDIPLEGRITAVADVFDALSTRRCYKDAIPTSTCFDMMSKERGTHFDPTVLDAFFAKRSEVIDVQMQYADDT
ncbi:Cyclic di-GMP phosphodiesterase response regulator RpfG [Posidoniimonas corsicana]|uniref:Cyclic di-GMP phosphodiesterase response regulator RpfG n=1 Tax=Posidoniimonas corsicana TaxID=1938618 RepID=A0A5C5VFE2_9BACT|nr:HD domain-containing phosphohydrolase [Posidoniimonas corsicana]TWT37388.1 Cyclic di-GMP phosphodiesterase response regulator RpfG [Posidoniimonas corsicana]